LGSIGNTIYLLTLPFNAIAHEILKSISNGDMKALEAVLFEPVRFWGRSAILGRQKAIQFKLYSERFCGQAAIINIYKKLILHYSR